MICCSHRSYSKKCERNGAIANNKGNRARVLTITSRPLSPAQGLLRLGPVIMRCALGKGGVVLRKREGDAATPRASMRVLFGYYRADRTCVQPTAVPFRTTLRNDGWCDAPGDRNYNRPVRLPYPASHERMWRADRLYDVCVVLDWNVRGRQHGKGSAIFLHIAGPGYPPTAGCIAVSPRDMRRLLPFLSKGARIRVSR